VDPADKPPTVDLCASWRLAALRGMGAGTTRVADRVYTNPHPQFHPWMIRRLAVVGLARIMHNPG